VSRCRLLVGRTSRISEGRLRRWGRGAWVLCRESVGGSKSKDRGAYWVESLILHYDFDAEPNSAGSYPVWLKPKLVLLSIVSFILQDELTSTR